VQIKLTLDWSLRCWLFPPAGDPVMLSLRNTSKLLNLPARARR